MRGALAVVALGLAAAGAAAAPLPPPVGGAAGADPGALDTAAAVAALVRVGLDPAAARERVARLGPEERRRLAEAAESLAVGGAHRTILGVLGGLLALLLLLLLAL